MHYSCVLLTLVVVCILVGIILFLVRKSKWYRIRKARCIYRKRMEHRWPFVNTGFFIYKGAVIFYGNPPIDVNFKWTYESHIDCHDRTGEIVYIAQRLVDKQTTVEPAYVCHYHSRPKAGVIDVKIVPLSLIAPDAKVIVNSDYTINVVVNDGYQPIMSQDELNRF